MDRSLAFYRDLFGMEILMDLDFRSESRLGEIVGMPNASARVVHLKLGDAVLELFEYREPRGHAIPADRKQADNGFVHIGFKVTDIQTVYADLTANRVSFFHAPIELRPGAWVAYLYGPDGEVCELRQTPG